MAETANRIKSTRKKGTGTPAIAIKDRTVFDEFTAYVRDPKVDVKKTTCATRIIAWFLKLPDAQRLAIATGTEQ